jgi:hypothetical protein
MKAMSTSLVIVVTAIVLLVTAAVVLTLFGQFINLAVPLTQAATVCQTEQTFSCSAGREFPQTWYLQDRNVIKDGTTKKMSCAEILKDEGITCTCKDSKLTCVTNQN